MSDPSARTPGGEPRFAPLGFPDLPAWGRTDHRAALFAFRRSASAILRSEAGPSAYGLRPADFAPAARAVLEGPADPTAAEARAFFERVFRPAEILEGGTPAPCSVG